MTNTRIRKEQITSAGASSGQVLSSDGLGGAEWATGGGSGGGSTSDTYANRPAAGNEGNIFIPTDGYTIERDNGTSWDQWLGVFPKVNIASLLTTNATFQKGLYRITGDTNTINVVAPWTATVGFMMTGLGSAGAVAGMGTRGTNNYYYIFRIARTTSSDYTPSFYTAKFDASYVYNSSYKTEKWLHFAPYIWMRINDNGTNRISSFSLDGENWTVYHSIGRTDWTTVNRVFLHGFGSNMLVFHWEVVSS
jgi:hypothetical protein